MRWPRKSEKLGVEVFPNPVKDLLHIRLNDDSQFKTIRLVDVAGKEIAQRIVSQLEEIIELSGVQNGVYILELISNEYSIRYRLVKN